MPPRSSESAQQRFTVHLPGEEQQGYAQDAEWMILESGEEHRRIRFHDYDEIYNVPGLYEHLFYEKLECTSPTVVRDLVGQAIDHKRLEADHLTFLDVGAGNGMVGEQLHDLGIGSLVGVDIIPEAMAATQRDRPGVYDEYRVVDLTDVSAEDDKYFEAAGFTGMTTVAALGFGDIPPAAFAQAYNYVVPDGLVAFTIKENFVADEDQSGFSRLIKQMLDADIIEELDERRYRHRLSVSGDPLYYLAYVAEKHDDIPAEWIDS